jgi:hypothetical protein
MNKIVEYVYTHLPQDVFTDRDIALMDPDSSHDSRYGQVKRAIKAGDMIRIKRGLYCLAKKFQRRPFDHFSIAQLIYGPSYISMESALSYHGWIPEGVFQTTSASMLRTCVYQTPIGDFFYRRVVQEQFYESVDHVATQAGSYFMARPFKALCDYIYAHKQSWESVGALAKSLRIEEQMFHEITKDDIRNLYLNYRSRRVKAFIQVVKKDLGL